MLRLNVSPAPAIVPGQAPRAVQRHTRRWQLCAGGGGRRCKQVCNSRRLSERRCALHRACSCSEHVPRCSPGSGRHTASALGEAGRRGAAV